jgi:hypothetical protein
MSRIREIEDKAGTVFAGLDLIEERLDASSPPLLHRTARNGVASV